MPAVSTYPATVTESSAPGGDLFAFTYSDVAERLAVSLSTVERLVARGELQEKRIGRAVRITASSLRRYLDGGAS